MHLLVLKWSEILPIVFVIATSNTRMCFIYSVWVLWFTKEKRAKRICSSLSLHHLSKWKHHSLSDTSQNLILDSTLSHFPHKYPPTNSIGCILKINLDSNHFSPLPPLPPLSKLPLSLGWIIVMVSD